MTDSSARPLSKITVGMPACLASNDRRNQRRGIERRQHDAVDALGDEILHDVDLALAIVFEQRALPVDLDVAQLHSGGLQRPGMHRLPEHVRRALGDHGDA